MAAGSIEKRTGKYGTASYRVTVELPADPVTGERERKRGTFRTKEEAEKARAAWVTEVDSGIFVKTTTMTVADLSAQWLDVKRPALKPRTLIHYEYTIAARIKPAIGSIQVQRINPATIDTLYALLRAEGCSEDAVHRCHQRLLQIFDYAVKRRIIGVNPMLAIDAPTVRTAAPSILSVPQIQRFLTFAHADAYNPLWLLLVQTGMRRGEALGVRWSDIDLESGKLRVRQCIEVLDNRPHIQTPKSPAALRTLTLFPESIAALKAHRTRQLHRRIAASEWQDQDLVFCTPNGGPLHPRNVLRNLAIVQRAANATAEDESEALPRFDIHDLRHTHATHLLQAGWSIPTVSRRLGHANPGITMTIYAHALSDTQGEANTTPTAFAFAGTA
jgi:integrase